MSEDRFRFRAWNKISREMVYWSGMMFDFMAQIEDGKYNGISEPIVRFENYRWKKQMLGGYSDPMQCTGLRDKNGALIWEGDIVTHVLTLERSGDPDEGGCFYQVQITGPVRWRSTKGCVVQVKRRELTACSDDDCEYAQFTAKAYPLHCSTERTEVIGNIYENPELLEPND